jgi:hypothetical protein
MEERSETRVRDKGNVQIFIGMEGNISFLLITVIDHIRCQLVKALCLYII